MDEIITAAAILNIILLIMAYLSGSRAVVVLSSLVWIIIGFALYQSYPETEGTDYQIKTLLLALSYLIAFAQIFIPLNSRNLPG